MKEITEVNGSLAGPRVENRNREQCTVVTLYIYCYLICFRNILDFRDATSFLLLWEYVTASYVKALNIW